VTEHRGKGSLKRLLLILVVLSALMAAVWAAAWRIEHDLGRCLEVADSGVEAAECVRRLGTPTEPSPFPG
jgi:hypothetical protein